MKIGIAGGTFDPIHRGHVHFVLQMIQRLGLDKVYVIPVKISPFKKEKPPSAGEKERLEMAKLAFQRESKVEILPLEIERGGISYTIDTLKSIREMHPHDQIYLLLAEDTIVSFPRWKETEAIFKLVTVVFAIKEGTRDQYKKREGVEYIEIPWIPISSTEIRKGLKDHREIENFLDKEVVDYIRNHHLYSL